MTSNKKIHGKQFNYSQTKVSAFRHENVVVAPIGATLIFHRYQPSLSTGPLNNLIN